MPEVHQRPAHGCTADRRAAGHAEDQGDRVEHAVHRGELPDLLVQERPQDRQPDRLRAPGQAAARQQHHREGAAA
eukprot:scaffold80558_cov63-Phaeocystis_antarctica.AAC.1